MINRKDVSAETPLAELEFFWQGKCSDSSNNENFFAVILTLPSDVKYDLYLHSVRADKQFSVFTLQEKPLAVSGSDGKEGKVLSFTSLDELRQMKVGKRTTECVLTYWDDHRGRLIPGGVPCVITKPIIDIDVDFSSVQLGNCYKVVFSQVGIASSLNVQVMSLKNKLVEQTTSSLSSSSTTLFSENNLQSMKEKIIGILNDRFAQEYNKSAQDLKSYYRITDYKPISDENLRYISRCHSEIVDSLSNLEIDALAKLTTNISGFLAAFEQCNGKIRIEEKAKVILSHMCRDAFVRVEDCSINAKAQSIAEHLVIKDVRDTSTFSHD